MDKNTYSRRKILQKLGLGGTLALSAGVLNPNLLWGKTKELPAGESLKGRINHSLCAWPLGFLTLHELCDVVRALEINTIDLVAPKDFQLLKDKGVHCSMCYTSSQVSLTNGWNDPENHTSLIQEFKEGIPLVAAAGFSNVICFSGNRRGMDDETGLQNCVKGLQQILPLAEKKGITVIMELFNSKVDHPDYMADRTSWGVALCEKLQSPNFKLLYDIYHMQINEGDVIRTIRNNHQWIAHYHTAGVPGRSDIDETQELYYPAIMQAIADTGFTGYVAQEFIPSGNSSEEKLNAIKKAIKICDI